MIYAGIGSRSTPKPMLDKIMTIAKYLAEKGHTLRSGAAEGADASFEIGCNVGNGIKEIYLPWPRFRHNDSKLCYVSDIALDMASQIHPVWDHLSDAAQKLMGRNTYQILGQDLKTPCDIVICWTSDGYNGTSVPNRTFNSGGTGQAIQIAIMNNIPVYNLKNVEDMVHLRAYLRSLNDAK